MLCKSPSDRIGCGKSQSGLSSQADDRTNQRDAFETGPRNRLSQPCGRRPTNKSAHQRESHLLLERDSVVPAQQLEHFDLSGRDKRRIDDGSRHGSTKRGPLRPSFHNGQRLWISMLSVACKLFAHRRLEKAFSRALDRRGQHLVKQCFNVFSLSWLTGGSLGSTFCRSSCFRFSVRLNGTRFHLEAMSRKIFNNITRQMAVAWMNLGWHGNGLAPQRIQGIFANSFACA